ncbi:hypothetical protein WN943_029606 [Citrus x changshan-huyou]
MDSLCTLSYVLEDCVFTDLEDNHPVLQIAYEQCVEMSKLHNCNILPLPSLLVLTGISCLPSHGAIISSTYGFHHVIVSAICYDCNYLRSGSFATS